MTLRYIEKPGFSGSSAIDDLTGYFGSQKSRNSKKSEEKVLIKINPRLITIESFKLLRRYLADSEFNTIDVQITGDKPKSGKETKTIENMSSDEANILGMYLALVFSSLEKLAELRIYSFSGESEINSAFTTRLTTGLEKSLGQPRVYFTSSEQVGELVELPRDTIENYEYSRQVNYWSSRRTLDKLCQLPIIGLFAKLYRRLIEGSLQYKFESSLERLNNKITTETSKVQTSPNPLSSLSKGAPNKDAVSPSTGKKLVKEQTSDSNATTLIAGTGEEEQPEAHTQLKP